jgi:hypothetical protein
MLQEFTLNRGRAIINFSLKYCDNRQKILRVTRFIGWLNPLFQNKER